MNVFRSGKHIYAQVIDDSSQTTLQACSSIGLKEKSNSVEKAKKVGEKIGRQAVDKKIKQVVFDRGGFIYHGRVKALAEGARSVGLKF